MFIFNKYTFPRCFYVVFDTFPRRFCHKTYTFPRDFPAAKINIIIEISKLLSDYLLIYTDN